MKACGLSEDTAIMNETEFYVSHECLLMEYEQALTRQDSTTGLWCALLTCLSACCWPCCTRPVPTVLAHLVSSRGWSCALCTVSLVCGVCVCACVRIDTAG